MQLFVQPQWSHLYELKVSYILVSMPNSSRVFQTPLRCTFLTELLQLLQKIPIKIISDAGTTARLPRQLRYVLQMLALPLQLIINFMSSRTISALPQRGKNTHLERCQKVTLLSNLFKVDFKDTAKVYIYALKTTPEIPREGGKKLRTLLTNSRSSIERQVGPFVMSGRTIFATKIQGNGKQELNFKADLEATSYQITLRMVKEINFSDVQASEKEKSGVIFSFLNNMIRNFFRQMKYTEIGRSGKFCDASSQKTLPGANVTIFKGFSSNFTLLENGLFLRVDPMMKIIRNETVLDVINNVYKRYSSAGKAQKRLYLEEELIGKMVMANYGKNRCYIIDSVIFDVAMESFEFNHDGKNINLLEYYSRTYDISIQSKRQPLLKAKSNKKTPGKEKDTILIPQLCLMGGLPDGFDERKRREISQVAITSPGDKLADIETMFQNLCKIETDFNPQVIGDKLGIKMSNSPMPITAKQMYYPELMLGEKQRIQQNKATCFMLFNKALFNRDITLKICMFLPTSFDFSPIKKLLESTAANIGLQYKLISNPINYADSSKALKNIENIVREQSQTKATNIFWFIIPQNFKSQYKSLKRMTLSKGIEMTSQVTVVSNLEKKGFQSIFTKILLQMSVKVGNKLWVPKVSNKVQSSGVMFIGIESTKDSEIRDKSVISYCANTSKDFSSFYSNFLYENKNDLKTNMKEIVFNSINQYIDKSGSTPSEVFVLKNGTTKLDVDCYIQTEVNQIKDILKCISKSHDPIKLTYIILDKNSSQKFFLDKGRGVVNPSSGTLVTNEAVGKNFEFYLIAQQCNRGTVKPTFYKVAYTDTVLDEGIIEELIYSQCFNYMNWTGSIKVPSIMQYAKKLGAFVSQYHNKESKIEQLQKNLYYI